MKIKFQSAINCIVLTLVTITSVADFASAQSLTSATTVRYNGVKGDLRITHTFNRKPSAGCTMRVVASISNEGESTHIAKRTILRTRVSQKIVRFNAFNLPAIQLGNADEERQLNLQTSFDCTGETSVYSSPDAVKIVCGRGANTVTPTYFLGLLAKRATVTR